MLVPRVQKAVLGELQWGDCCRVPGVLPALWGHLLGARDRAGGSGLCLAGNKGCTAPTDRPMDAFSTPHPIPHVLHQQQEGLESPITNLCPALHPAMATLPGFEDSGWGLGLMLGKKRVIKVM